MSHGRSIRLFLIDGSVTGIRHAELYNWTGQAIACPRRRLGELKEWYEEFPAQSRTGVYFLFGRAESDAVYIGESENTLTRLGQQLERDFWHEAVIFTNKDHNLTKAHGLYLEAQLIRRTEQAKRYRLENGTRPTIPSLAPAERAPMDEFIENMRLLLGVLGYRVLEPLSEPAINLDSLNAGTLDSGATSGRSVIQADENQFFFKTTNADATGRPTDEGFLILAGSTADRNETNSLYSTYKRARQLLMDSNRLRSDGDKLIFTEDHLCNSPSYAASILAGTNKNGLTSWQRADGKTLKDIQVELARQLEDQSTSQDDEERVERSPSEMAPEVLS